VRPVRDHGQLDEIIADLVSGFEAATRRLDGIRDS
jgi:hypothetical protein